MLPENKGHVVADQHAQCNIGLTVGLTVNPLPQLTLVSLQCGDKLKTCGLQLQHANLATVVRYEGVLVGRIKPEFGC